MLCAELKELAKDEEAVAQASAEVRASLLSALVRYRLFPLADSSEITAIPEWGERDSVAPGLTSAQWFERFWAPLLLRRAVTRPMLRRHDPNFENTFRHYLLQSGSPYRLGDFFPPGRR